MKIRCLPAILIWMLCVNEFTNALEYVTRVEDFMRQFTALFNQHAPSYRENDLDSDYLNSIKEHFSHVLEQYDPLGEKPHRPGYGFPSSPPYDPEAGQPHHPGYGFPSRPPYDPEAEKPHHHGFGFPSRPPPYPPQSNVDDLEPPHSSVPTQPPLGAHPHTSFFVALDSIAKHDDLRCVPRLLCEVTSGSNFTVGRKNNKDKPSPIPFLSRDAVIALLTVLNFVDDSPVLLFARAAFLGYSAKGDTRVCLNAYPLCPKDPDQLVNYLNNHNGGFFKFFNQQLQQQQPNYHLYAKKYFNDGRDLKFLPASNFRFASRILHTSIENEETANFEKLTNSQLPVQSGDNSQFAFSSEIQPQSDAATHDGNDNNNYSVYPSRVGKKIAFPGQVTKSFTTNVMIFPDRTGTGNLILSGDPSVGLRISYAEDSYKNVESGTRFFNDNQKFRYGKKLRFPV